MAKDRDKDSVIASVRTVKARRTAAVVEMNHSRTGNHVWTKSVLQSVIGRAGIPGVTVQRHVVVGTRFENVIAQQTVAQEKTQKLEAVMIMTVLMEWEYMAKLMNMHIFNMETAMI